MLPKLWAFIALICHGIAEDDESTCSSPLACAAEALPEPTLHVDKYVKRALAETRDPSCQVNEYKLSSYAGLQDALAAFSHCRTLVVRNLLPIDIAGGFSERVVEWLLDVRDGHAAGSCSGSTHNDGSWAQKLDDGNRWEILIPQRLATTDLVSIAPIEDFMSKALGDNFVLHSAGLVTADPGAKAGSWHRDNAFLWEGNGMSAHDVPPYAITLAIALSDTPADMGPTELCIGSSWITGFDFPNEHEEGRLSPEYASLLTQISKECPEFASRRTHLGIGDAIVWDYAIAHRGGPNFSNRTRALLYLTYSLPWFRDTNFDVGKLYRQDVQPTEHLQRRLYRARLALSPTVSSRSARPTKPLWNFTNFGSMLQESHTC